MKRPKCPVREGRQYASVWHSYVRPDPNIDFVLGSGSLVHHGRFKPVGLKKPRPTDICRYCLQTREVIEEMAQERRV